MGRNFAAFFARLLQNDRSIPTKAWGAIRNVIDQHVRPQNLSIVAVCSPASTTEHDSPHHTNLLSSYSLSRNTQQESKDTAASILHNHLLVKESGYKKKSHTASTSHCIRQPFNMCINYFNVCVQLRRLGPSREHPPTSRRRLPVPTRSWALSTHPSGQLVCMSTRTVTHVAWSGPNGVLNTLGHSEAMRDARGCMRGRDTRMPGSEAAVEWRM